MKNNNMTTFQKVIKYSAIALAVCLTVGIIGGIISAVSLMGIFFGDGNVLEDAKTYEVSNDIKSLNININAADFKIIESDKFSVESNLEKLTVEEKYGTLIINEKKKFNGNYKGAALNLYIPAGTSFERVEISSGAGRVDIGKLSASSADFDFGAGEVMIGYIEASSYAEIDGGAGKITISDGKISNLDLDMGVGKLDFTSRLSGDNEFSLGVGESNLIFIGSENDYSTKIEKGLGVLKVKGKTVSEYKRENGESKINIEGGVGNINVNFKSE